MTISQNNNILYNQGIIENNSEMIVNTDGVICNKNQFNNGHLANSGLTAQVIVSGKFSNDTSAILDNRGTFIIGKKTTV